MADKNNEKEIRIEYIDPIDLFGANDKNLKIIKEKFPKLKIIARGDTVKLVGSKSEIEKFEERLEKLVKHFNKYNALNENNVERLMDGEEKVVMASSKESSLILVHGVGGKKIKARTVNQRKMVDSSRKNDIVFAIGPAGTGKTYTAVALAVQALKNREVNKIILARPAVEAGEHLGFLPGDMKEKFDPFVQPIYDALGDMFQHDKLNILMEREIIQIAPLAYMRGRTLDEAFVILDEAQNTTKAQLKMFLTRLGSSAKFVITGDVTQIDLPRKNDSGLMHAKNLLEGIKGIDFITLDEKDVVRHKLVKKIIVAYDKDEQ
ncbi:MAG: PhoH family protein [Flavobacteriales bacterium]|nr:PhoH family protein [Flavobacteriales bacterium]